MKEKISELLCRLNEIEELLGDPDIVQEQEKYKELTQEHSQLSELKECSEKLAQAESELKDNHELLQVEQDPDFKVVLEEDISSLEQVIHDLNVQIENLLVPPDPADHRNTIMEIRAGTGGAEAALFVADIVRMYKLYSDRNGWNYESLSSTPSELGGYKDYVMVVSGNNVHRFLQYEAGTHRVQRVPDTEAQGRVHTSAVTVAVLAEPSKEEEVDLDEKDLRIDTFRASGAGGQHVNVTDSAVRITHLPSGIVVACQDERSQHKNKAKAMRLLNAKLAEVEKARKQKEMADTRSSQVGTGDRSERIRTYNFPQNRITDHRVNLTLYHLDRAIEGELDEITSTLVSHFHQLKIQEA